MTTSPPEPEPSDASQRDATRPGPPLPEANEAEANEAPDASETDASETDASEADASEATDARETDASDASDFDRDSASIRMLNWEHGLELFAFAGGKAAAYVRRCPGKPTQNEDSLAAIAVSPDAGVLAIADGVGGERFGDRASRTVVESIIASVGSMPPTDDARPSILNGIETANQQLMGEGGASTLALVEICGDTIRPYHVGDSMMMLIGQRGRVKWQTVPHSPVGYAIEAGILNERDAIYHKDRHLVSNIVGAENMRIEVGPQLKMAPRDTLLVASDGLFDNLHLSEIIEFVRKGPLDRAIERLTASVTQRMQGYDHVVPGEEDTEDLQVLAEDDMPSKPDDTSILLFRRW